MTARAAFPFTVSATLRLWPVLALLAAGSGQAAAPAVDGARAERVAQSAGCFSCHQIDPRSADEDEDSEQAAATPAAARPPIAPAWRNVATKYRHDGGALERLTRAVLGGSNPYDPHWKYQVTGLAMPANRIAISEDDARLVVRWILSLDDPD
ncbi:c-type cytochrome [Ideonella oryzae]|uniref:C-type cytochrome n=1 Tax=Ideonella oryzae TaxID=2937441 RepID=A0ABT1BT11_9BURK|nr:c-type cytochrome [Ideonella oryzae]MCO5978552.1 c-type cytochrome [Ideonella oryzae]